MTSLSLGKMEEGSEEIQEAAETVDTNRVVLITPADLRFNIEKKSTQRSKRQVGIDELNRVLGLGESGHILLTVQPPYSPPTQQVKTPIQKSEESQKPAFLAAKREEKTSEEPHKPVISTAKREEKASEKPHKPAISTAKREEKASEEPQKPVFLTAKDEEKTSEEPIATPRLPFELPADSNAFIMNIDSEGASPTVQHITRPTRGRPSLHLPAEETPRKKLEVTNKAPLSVLPEKKEERAQLAAPTPSPTELVGHMEEDEETSGYATLQNPYLHLENSLSDMILPKNPAKKKRKKRAKRGLVVKEIGTGPLVALTPQAGRLIQVREYVITPLDQSYSPTLPSLYSPDVQKALNSFDSSSRRRRIFPQSNSPANTSAFRSRAKDTWKTPCSLGSLAREGTRIEGREQLGWNAAQLRKMSMRVL